MLLGNKETTVNPATAPLAVAEVKVVPPGVCAPKLVVEASNWYPRLVTGVQVTDTLVRNTEATAASEVGSAMVTVVPSTVSAGTAFQFGARMRSW